MCMYHVCCDDSNYSFKPLECLVLVLGFRSAWVRSPRVLRIDGVLNIFHLGLHSVGISLLKHRGLELPFWHIGFQMCKSEEPDTAASGNFHFPDSDRSLCFLRGGALLQGAVYWPESTGWVFFCCEILQTLSYFKTAERERGRKRHCERNV